MSYKIIYSIEPNLYKEGSPVVIQSGALVVNTENERLHVQIKFKNVSNKDIKMLKAEIVMQDVTGREVGRGEKQYLDLNAKIGDSFAGQDPVYLKDKTVRKITVNVVEVYFSDESLYTGNNLEWETLPVQQSITSKFANEALDEYKAVFCKDAKFLPLIHKDIWLCACGEVNHSSRRRCCKCSANIDLIKELDASTLRSENIYKNAMGLINQNNSFKIEEGIKKLESIATYKDAKEKIDFAKQRLENVKKNENEARLLKTKQEKKRKAIIISSISAVVAVIIVIVLTVNVFIPNSKFKKAQNLLNEKNYTQAYIVLNELVDEHKNYKNAYQVLCDSKFNRAVEYIAKGEDKLAYELLKDIKNYKTSKNLISGIWSRAKNKAMKFAEEQDFESAIAVLNEVDITEKDFPIRKAYNAMIKRDFKTAVNAGITNLIIPSGVTSIDDYALSGCTSLRSVVIPDSVTSIGNYAFGGCKGLTSIVIPNSVTEIGNYAFKGCTSLTSITIGNKVKSIGSSVFYGCTSLKSLVIPDSVTEIGNYAFTDCTSLTSITIGNKVKSIGSSVFSGCTSLKSLVIPDSVTEIGNYAFDDCKGLTSIVIPNSVKTIGSSILSGCSSLQEITIPFIGDKAEKTANSNYQYPLGYLFGESSYTGGKGTSQQYYGYSYTISDTYYIPTSLKKVTVTGGNVLYGAFYNCSSLTSVTIANGVTSIGKSAFYNCSSLKSIVIPNSVTQIGNYAFTDCTSLTSVTIGNGVTEIGDSAFYNCSSLISVVIPIKVKSINASTFNGCKLLTSVVMPNGVTSIGNYAFSGCSSLKSIVIPNSVKTIGSSILSGCSSLQEITIPFIGDKAEKTANSTYQYPLGYLFGGSSYTGGKGTFQLYYGYSLSYKTSDTYYIPMSLKKVTVTGGNILYGAFYNCSSLTSVTLGNGVTTIEEKAFYECSSLTSVVISDSVTKIGSYAFSGCAGLASVTIGNGVTSIGDHAFYSCKSLTSIVFNDTTTWYRTSNYTNWENKTGGTQINVSTASQNASNFTSYYSYYWYKK